MARSDARSGFLVGLLTGAAAAVAAIIWVQRTRRARAAGIEGRAEADRQLRALEKGSSRSRARREEKAGRKLASRIEELRNAGL